ncbi:MAG: hypothetical protein JWP59_3466 [Massilia sp.]|nr:hypothetical protein [Massilia sp.]
MDATPIQIVLRLGGGLFGLRRLLALCVPLQVAVNLL